MDGRLHCRIQFNLIPLHQNTDSNPCFPPPPLEETDRARKADAGSAPTVCGELSVSQSVSLRGSMCDSGRRKTDRQLSWLKVGLDGTELPLSASGRAHKWRVRGWVGGLYVKLKEAGMDGKGTLKMFTRKKRELIKTPSISKKSRAGSPGSQSGAQSVSASLLLTDCHCCSCALMTFSWRGGGKPRGGLRTGGRSCVCVRMESLV